GDSASQARRVQAKVFLIRLLVLDVVKRQRRTISMLKLSLYAAAICLFAAGKSLAADTPRRTVIFDGAATEVMASAQPSKDLWVTMKDLKRATRFVVKPQGICRDELCFPIRKGRNAEFISKKGSISWFNLSEFARLVKQPVAA